MSIDIIDYKSFLKSLISFRKKLMLSYNFGRKDFLRIGTCESQVVTVKKCHQNFVISLM